MDDPSVFAELIPCDDRNMAHTAFKLLHDKRWFRKAAGGIAEEPTINSREPTPAKAGPAEDQDFGAVDRLIVTFNELLEESENFPNGLQFGTSTRLCHVLLGHRGTPGVSAKQYSITVDDNLWIWLYDYYSMYGTVVSHDGQNINEVRKKETWLLAFGPGRKPLGRSIKIRADDLAFKIRFPNHKAADPAYMENLHLFARKCKAAVPQVGALGLNSEPRTLTPSQPQTPGERPLYYDDGRVGRGTFGDVHRYVRLRDGKCLAAKKFFRQANKRRRNADSPEWLLGIRREFDIMKDNPHPNVIRVIELRETRNPFIVMEYYEHGNMTEADIKYDQYVTACGQILDGLGHLHAKGIAHRDLKPENFLVQKDPYFKVVITDFGLSKVVTDATVLTTFCGTLKYLAPESFPGMSCGYSPLVDVWATGVIFLEWLYNIPECPTPPKPRQRNGELSNDDWYSWIDTWSCCLLNRLEDEEEDTVVQILVHMIEVDPKKRWAADRCLELGFDNGLFRRDANDLVVGA